MPRIVLLSLIVLLYLLNKEKKSVVYKVMRFCCSKSNIQHRLNMSSSQKRGKKLFLLRQYVEHKGADNKILLSKPNPQIILAKSLLNLLY